MSVLRMFGWGVILVAVVVAMFDATRSTGSGGYAARTIGELWGSAHPATLTAARTATQNVFSADVFEHVIQPALSLPTWFMLGLLGLILLTIAGRRRSGVSVTARKQDPALACLLRGCGLGLLIATVVLGIFDVYARPAPRHPLVSITLGEVLHSFEAARPQNSEPSSSKQEPNGSGSWLSSLLHVPVLLISGLIGLGLYRLGVRRRDAANETGEEAGAQGEAPKSSQATLGVVPRSEVADALASCRSAFFSIGLFSGISNVLMLTGAFFMLQIYDRVLPSGSVPTLVALAILVAVLFAFLAMIDMIRSRILVRIGGALDDALSERVYEAIVRVPLRMGNRGEGLQPLRDLDAVRTFLSGPGPTALFDLPWLPFYLAIIFSFHTALGITALIGAIVLVTLTLFTEALARKPMKDASGFAQTRNGLAEASRRNAEVLAAMGMAGRMNARWGEANQSYLTNQQRASDVTGGFGSVSKALRMMLQSAVLGIGAYLVIHQAATAGIIIAAAILVARALAPVDLAIANWKGFLAARQSWKRLTQLLERLPPHERLMALPAPRTNVTVEHVSAVPPGERKVVVQDINFVLSSGQGLGIIGPSASGKSSLVRTIVGAWQPARGRIRLDGAALDQWSPEALGAHIGYLPQDVELFSGTVAENVARFETEADAEAIITAAQAAGVHDLIVGLPHGYETEIGEQGQVLSAGQRQRIALARALYREPFLVVLDEPNSNLDSDGEVALTQAIFGVRKRGGIVIVVAHRPSALAAVDLVLVMTKGAAVNFGPKDEVLPKVLAQKSTVQRPPLTVVPDAGTKT